MERTRAKEAGGGRSTGRIVVYSQGKVEPPHRPPETAAAPRPIDFHHAARTHYWDFGEKTASRNQMKAAAAAPSPARICVR